MAHQPIVTTSRDADAPYYEGEARAIAAAVGGRYVPRDDRSLESLFAEGYPVVVFGGTGMRIHTRSGEIGWHPGMGHARVRQLRKGARDPMVEAMDLRPGDAVLDATLGLGSDALVASYVTGDTGRVLGWESVPVLAELVRRGMQTWVDDDDTITAALRRIQVECADHRTALAHLPSGSFDIVYFDPMFREPVYESAHFTPLREIVDDRPLDRASVQEARRVARRRVVIKERRGSPVFQELGVTTVIGGRKSRIAYGIIPASGAEG